MKTLRLLHPASFLVLLMALWLPASAADQPLTEKAKIEALLQKLENLKDATFLRNDQALPPKEAVTLMREKWKAQGENIKTATEFIDKLMTASSSGARKPYVLRYKDGKETKCAEYLKAELKKLETKPADKEKPQP